MYERQYRAYEAAFEMAKEDAATTLPSPTRFWVDQNEQAHRAVIWEGTHGLLILQQAAFDPQFGIEVNFWLDGRRFAEFQPETPLIDALCRRSQFLHDKYGFPSLEF